MWREAGEVSVVESCWRGLRAEAKRRASSRSSFSVTAASMTAPRSQSGIRPRMRARSRSSFSRRPALAVNCTLYRPGPSGRTMAGWTIGVRMIGGCTIGELGDRRLNDSWLDDSWRRLRARRWRNRRSKNRPSRTAQARRFPEASRRQPNRASSPVPATPALPSHPFRTELTEVTVRPRDAVLGSRSSRSGSRRIRAGTSLRGAISAINSSI